MNYKDHILQLISDAKISDQTAAQSMKISFGTFRKCKSEKSEKYNFTEKHLTALKSFLLNHAKTITFAVKSNQLETYSKEDSDAIYKAQEDAFKNIEETNLKSKL